MARWWSWMVASLLCLTVVLLSLAGTFHDRSFYGFAYARNGVFEDVGSARSWAVTGEFEGFLEGESSLSSFTPAEASHLSDVRGLYRLARGLASVFLGALSVLLFSLLLHKRRREEFSRALRRSSLLIVVLTAALSLLGLRWEWFFTLFHELFFSGNWMFSGSSLMIRLWGGSFFPLAAGYVALKNLVAAAFLFVLSVLISRR